MTIIEIKLAYRNEIYEAWINEDLTIFRDLNPIKAIQAALENHNCDINKEMYRVLKQIQKVHSSTAIDNVIEKYENDSK